jgi:hypothetical protein
LNGYLKNRERALGKLAHVGSVPGIASLQLIPGQ